MDQIINYKNVNITIRRDDLLHPLISGNKFRKLKYNILQAKIQNFSGIITFGGAYSNHILATAAAAREFNFKCIGIIRGDELKDNYKDNPTLNFAEQLGMQFIFVSREEYKKRNSEIYSKELALKYSDYYLVPEGGTNALAVKGCEEIITSKDSIYNYICCASGTGGTISGIINSLNTNQKALSFPVLKDQSLKTTIQGLITNPERQDWDIIDAYHFSGYGKVNDELIKFINHFFNTFDIPLDPVYTGKLFYGIFDMIDREIFNPNHKILAIHTGGLQGIHGMNQLLKKKNKETIKLSF